ncbi:MAG: GNAT family N-acetyltransferase [Bacillota bacterium]|jgi:ribosomal protein S18 acetylase RimI-like enzyme|nr:GNAT family N-acetyltransferase [Bacillota bacterium]HOC06717.1 GNAT family N-acetyltransferase [Bacillota bacterium]HPZ22266.1 GNAT family N-acetyltransferase [Bacillota bacterium]HQD20170.1 GNAT family N-acetyltransferase [Bacillota bacterium]
MIRIENIADAREKSLYAERVLRELPAWFGIEDALLDYIAGVATLPFWAALKGEMCVGFIAVKIHYGRTGDIYVMGILPEYQRRGIGQQLIEAAELYFRQKGCKYAIVKTLSDLARNEHYERTRRFYQKVGFEPLITLTEMWDAHNLCLIMIKEV